MPEPDYLARTREAWTKMSVEFEAPGRRAWSASAISWGIWEIPESNVNALGDLSELCGKDVIELGCGTAYFSAWLSRLGAKPVGIDPTPAQLDNARRFQNEHGVHFPLLEAYAEDLPFSAASFDLAVSEYGAAIWSDPYLWIPEASRVLRSGGKLVFLRNSPLAAMCTGPTGPAGMTLIRDAFGLNRIEWNKEEPEEFILPHGPMIQLLRASGFVVESLIELQAPEGAKTDFEYMTPEWARRWPSEEIWVATKV